MCKRQEKIIPTASSVVRSQSKWLYTVAMSINVVEVTIQSSRQPTFGVKQLPVGTFIIRQNYTAIVVSQLPPRAFIIQ
jgi:hypothetical protein